jgi:hypothetical protein
VLAAVFLNILEDHRQERSSSSFHRLFWLPVLMVLWANSHGGFAIGFILLGVYLIGTFGFSAGGGRFKAVVNKTALRSLSLILFLCLLGVCVNPYGPVMLLYPFKTVGISALQDYIQEWQSPNFHTIEIQPFIWLLMLTLGAVGFSRRRINFVDFVLVAGFVYMGLLAGRNVALFALVAPMVITRHVAPLAEALSRRWGFRPLAVGMVPRPTALLNLSIAAILLVAVGIKVALVYPRGVNESAFARGLPVEAVEYLQKKQPEGRLFNSYNWGGYLLWALPEYPVFVDGRTDLYNDEVIGEWIKVVRVEEGWDQVLDRWQVRLVLLEPGSPLLSELESVGWQLQYQDEVAVIYGR